MAKQKVQFLCSACGNVQPKWLGKCPDCGAWDTLSEFRPPEVDPHTPAVEGIARPDVERRAVPLSQVDEAAVPRLISGISEFDRILGGGLVAGSVVLIGGEPGIGKSTLLLQVADALAAAATVVNAAKGNASPGSGGEKKNPTVLYVTSEESARQTALRARRLGVASDELHVLAETNLNVITAEIARLRPAACVVDSIQMIHKPATGAAPGTVTQLRDCCADLVYVAKSTGTAILLVGHVTKAGTLAGPKIVEHMVDVVLNFEGDRHHLHRIVRCVKNRFGGTQEVGLFEMSDAGLREVTEAGRLFIEDYGRAGAVSGSVLTAAMQGTRVMLVEIQALTAPSVVGATRRKVSGVSSDRVAMILAVLEKRMELKLAADDVFVNVAGGVKVTEPAADLAVALAIATAHMNKPVPGPLLVIGELGLGGEIRNVSNLDLRLREAARLGVKYAIVPKTRGRVSLPGEMTIRQITRLSEAMRE